jgi:hypothetical protein
MYIDKSTINFINGKQFCGKTLDECKQSKDLVRNKIKPENVQDREISEISDTRGKDSQYKSFPRCLRFFRLALLPVLDPLYLFI